MNRKSIVFASVLAALLLAGIAFMFYSLFLKDGNTSVEYEPLADGVGAVPADAILFAECGRLSDISGFLDDRNTLRAFIECIPDYSSKWETALSLHYSSKNTVSPLMIVTCPDEKRQATVMQDVMVKCMGVVEKRYDSFIIHKSTVPDIAFTMYDRYIIASPSTVVVEASLRHILSEASITDIVPQCVSGVPNSDALLQVNFSNLGKMFSGMVSPSEIKYASFFQSVADWGAFALESGKSGKTIEGRLYTEGRQEKFADVLLSQKGRDVRLYSVAPHNALFVLSLPLSSADGYLSAYLSYLAARNKKKDYDFILATLPAAKATGVSPAKFVKSLDLSEIGVFSMDLGSEKTILALRAEKSEAIEMYADTLCEYPYKGYISAMFGKVFTPSAEDVCFAFGDWLFVGGVEEMEAFYRNCHSPNYFTLESYISQTPASGELKNASSLSVLVNAGKYHRTMASYFKMPYSSRLSRSFNKRNFEFIVMKFRKEDGGLGLRVASYDVDLEVMPAPKVKDKRKSVEETVDETVVEIPGGPFEITDFRDGSKNYLEQLPDNKLRLLNSARKGLWTIPFDTRLCGTVRQIDFLKNGKLQMLFGSGEKVYLFDRLGRKVGKFPISLGREILLGPDVYDVDGDKNYIMIVLHADNTVAQYDLEGRKVSWWNEIQLDEKIISLPERILAGKRIYWVVRTSYQTLIYDAQGVPVADFSKKRRLKKDSPVELLSAKEVGVVTSDGREMVLNLQNGDMRRK